MENINPQVSSVTITFNPSIEELKNHFILLNNQCDFHFIVDNNSDNIQLIKSLIKSLNQTKIYVLIN